MGALGVVGAVGTVGATVRVGGLGAVGTVDAWLLWGQQVLWAKWDLGVVWVQWEQWEMGVLQWVLTGEEAHGGYPARCLLLCTVQPCPARPGSARSCPALLINRGIYSPRASGILTDEATARLLHSTLITACKSREVGARPRPHRGAFPRAGGQQCPSVWPQSPGGAQALRQVPGQGRWGLGDSLTCSQGSHHTGQVGQCPAQQGHAQGRAQGHSQVTGQGDGGFSLLLSL